MLTNQESLAWKLGICL